MKPALALHPATLAAGCEVAVSGRKSALTLGIRLAALLWFCASCSPGPCEELGGRGDFNAGPREGEGWRISSIMDCGEARPHHVIWVSTLAGEGFEDDRAFYEYLFALARRLERRDIHVVPDGGTPGLSDAEAGMCSEIGVAPAPALWVASFADADRVARLVRDDLLARGLSADLALVLEEGFFCPVD